MEAVGADGLTNDQWVKATSQGANKGLSDEYREQNMENASQENSIASGKPGVGYRSADAAAIAWALHYYNVTANEKNDAEWSSLIYSFRVKGEIYYSFTEGVRFEEGEGHDPHIESPGVNSPLHKLPSFATRVAHIHSHLPITDAFGGQNENFSSADETQHSDKNNRAQLDFYLVNFQGYLKSFRADNGVVYPLGHGLDKKFDMNNDEKNYFRGVFDLKPLQVGFADSNINSRRKNRHNFPR